MGVLYCSRFDRFLNAERAKFSKMADIDLDLPWHRRDEVVRRVYDRWSHDRVAMIGAPNCFHARAAVADLASMQNGDGMQNGDAALFPKS